MNTQIPHSSLLTAEGGPAAPLSAALQQHVLGLTERLLEEVARAVSERVLEDVARLLDERVRCGVERETRALRENMRRMEEQMTALQATVNSGMQCVADRTSDDQRAMRSLEERQAEREVTAELSGRMERVEASLQRALGTMMPKVEALLAQLEAPPAAASSSAPPPAESTSSAPPPAESISSAPPPARSTTSAPPPARLTSSAPPHAAARFPSSATHPRLEADLFTAAEEGWTERVLELLDAGADVDAPHSSGMIPLHFAAAGGHVDAVVLLLARGADCEGKDRSGGTALHFAACNDRTGSCASLLWEAGADVHCANKYGKTPLHGAVQANNRATVRVLLAAGALQTARDRNGKTPLDYVRSAAIRRLLLRR